MTQTLPETKRLTGREYSAMLSLFSAISHYIELYPILGKRAEMVPGTAEMMEQTKVLTNEIIDRLLGTIPPEKLLQMKADIQHVKLYVKVEPPGCVPSVDMTSYSYVDTRTLNELLCYVMEHECMLCDKTPTEARHCPFLKIFDKALVHEVNARDTSHCKYSDMSIGMEETYE